mgnify:CR=1 FL=1
MQARAGRGDAGEGKEAVDGVERDEPRAAREERCDAGEAARRAHVLVERSGARSGRQSRARRDGVGCLGDLEDAEHRRGAAAAAVPVDERRGRERDDPAGRRLGVDVEVVGRAEDATREREVGGRRVQQAVLAGGEHGAEVPAGRGAERRDGLQVGVAQQRVDGDERPDVEAVCVGALVCPTATATVPGATNGGVRASAGAPPLTAKTTRRA